MSEAKKKPMLKIQCGDLYIEGPGEWAEEILTYVARHLGISFSEPIQKKTSKKEEKK